MRWHLPSPPGILQRRAIERLKLSFQKCPPRAGVVLISTWFNRWTTSRRFQQREVCPMCGEPDHADELEHFPQCSTVRALAEVCKLPPEPYGTGRATCLEKFMCIHKTSS